MIREEELVIIGDEAWTKAELERLERKRARNRRYRERHPERLREAYARWRARNPERAREINREHMRRKRKSVVGSLHSLACTGPTKATGCRCSKIRCYNVPRETPTEGEGTEYTPLVGVSDESDTISRGPVAPAYSRTAGSLRTHGSKS